MEEINIKDIGDFKLSELSRNYFNTTELTRLIANKKIKDVSTSDLLHLIRRKNYTELAALLAVSDFQTNGFNGFSFNHDDNSITRQDLLKELLILGNKFWTYNQSSFNRLKPIAEKNATYLNLPSQYQRQFTEFQPEPIVWTDEEIDRIKSFVEMDTASSVHSAWEMVRQLKRAVDEGTKVSFSSKGNSFDINSSIEIKEQIISLLPFAEDFENTINREIKIKEHIGQKETYNEWHRKNNPSLYVWENFAYPNLGISENQSVCKIPIHILQCNQCQLLVDKTSLDENHIKTIESIIKNQSVFIDDIREKSFEYYTHLWNDFLYEYDDENKYPNPNSVDNKVMDKLITPKAIHMASRVDEGYFGILFSTSFELEHGFGIRFRNYKVDEVGGEDIGFNLLPDK